MNILLLDLIIFGKMSRKEWKSCIILGNVGINLGAFQLTEKEFFSVAYLHIRNEWDVSPSWLFISVYYLFDNLFLNLNFFKFSQKNQQFNLLVYPKYIFKCQKILTVYISSIKTNLKRHPIMRGHERG